MASLLETLKKSTQTQQAPVAQDQTARAQDILRVGTTGKQQVATGPRRRQLTDQINAGQLQQQLDTLKQQKSLAIGGLQQREQQIQEQAAFQNQVLTQENINRQTELQQDTDKILKQFEQGEKELDLRKNGAELEQLGHNMRMSDDRYVFELQLAGERARLDNELAFKEQLANDIFEKEKALFEDELQFREFYAMDDNEFERYLNNLSFDAIARWKREDDRIAARTAPWQALAAAPQIAQSAMQIADMMPAEEFDTQPAGGPTRGPDTRPTFQEQTTYGFPKETSYTAEGPRSRTEDDDYFDAFGVRRR